MKFAIKRGNGRAKMMSARGDGQEAKKERIQDRYDRSVLLTSNRLTVSIFYRL
jgi:hypothetical protein